MRLIPPLLLECSLDSSHRPIGRVEDQATAGGDKAGGGGGGGGEENKGEGGSYHRVSQGMIVGTLLLKYRP